MLRHHMYCKRTTVLRNDSTSKIISIADKRWQQLRQNRIILKISNEATQIKKQLVTTLH